MKTSSFALLSPLYNLSQGAESETKELCTRFLTTFLQKYYPEEWRKKVTVVIPCKDEEKTIGSVLKIAKPFCAEIIVVDGNSKDRSAEVARDCGAKVIIASKNGKGSAMREAIGHVQSEVTVFMDADGSHHPYDIPMLVAPIFQDVADHVVGSRNLAGSDELHGDFGKLLRMVGSAIITVSINYRFGVLLTDSQNGFRAISTSVLRQLNLKSKITTIEQEMVMETLRSGFRMGEVPAHEYARKSGVSHIVLSRVWWRYVYVWVKGLMKGMIYK